jgi:hypothetical protein
MLKNKIAALILVLGTALTLIAPRLALADVKNQPDVKIGRVGLAVAAFAQLIVRFVLHSV